LPAWQRLPPAVFDATLYREDLQELLSRRHPGWRRLMSEHGHGGRWHVVWNEATFLPHRIVSDRLVLDACAPAPVERGASGLDPSPGDEDLDACVRAFIARYPELAPVAADDELALERIAAVGPELRLLRYTQEAAGVPVWGSRLEVLVDPSLRVRHLVLDLLPSAWLRARVRLEPELDSAAALAAVKPALGSLAELLPSAARLWIVPLRRSALEVAAASDAEARPGAWLRPVLAWELRLEGPAGGEHREVWSCFVAAAAQGGVPAGKLLGRFDHSSHANVVGRVRGLATPGWLPDAGWNPPSSLPLRQLTVLGRPLDATDAAAAPVEAVTGEDGYFYLSTESAESMRLQIGLEGPYCKVENAAGEAIARTGVASVGSIIGIAFNLEADELQTAQVNAFVHVNVAHDAVKALAPWLTDIDAPVVARVNVHNLPCNSRFVPLAPGVLEFSRSGPCANSAYSTWIHHEYGHFVIWKAFGDRPVMPAYNEGMADVLPMLITRGSIIGEAFDGQPLAVAGSLGHSRDLARPQARFPADLLQEPHLAGQIVGGAIWRLFERLHDRYQDPDARRARDIVGRLWVQSLQLAPAGISPDLVLDFLLLDDDNDNVFDGTPHAVEIAAAFAGAGLMLPDALEMHHQPIPDQPADASSPIPVEMRVTSSLEFLAPISATLLFSTDHGNTYQAVPMDAAGADGAFSAVMPRQGAGTTVRYFMEVRNRSGWMRRLPAGAPQGGTFVFAVAEIREVFSDPGPEVWKHGTVDNGFASNHDDWEWGWPKPAAPLAEDLIDGNLLDPPAPFAGEGHWGNDLALDAGGDKLYADTVHNFLESQAIDASGYYGIHLRFRRWMSAERDDRLRLLVNDVLVYESPAGYDTFDSAWKLVDFNIGTIADNQPSVRLRFELESDSYARAGGWNLDDIRLIATQSRSDSAPFVRRIEPSFDALTGNSPFVIHGLNFPPDGLTLVYFGGQKAESVVVDGPETISGLIPPGRAPGLVSVTVVARNGNSVLHGAFRYFGTPEIDAIFPSAGGLAGGTLISIKGSNFTPGRSTRIWVGGRIADAEAIDPTLTVGLLPPGDDVGAVDVRLSTPYGRATSIGAFTYTSPPRLDRIEPTSTSLGHRPLFTLSGDYFPTEGGAARVFFGEDEAGGILVLGRGTLLGSLPPGRSAGTVDVRVVTPDGEATLEDGFTYLEPGLARFVRGDANLDRVLDLSDAVTVLGYLFIGRTGLGCRDAADLNDDGILDISDPVGLLYFLFDDGKPPPSPYPEAGVDPTQPDGLECERGI
jgi:hypothetical protein